MRNVDTAVKQTGSIRPSLRYINFESAVQHRPKRIPGSSVIGLFKDIISTDIYITERTLNDIIKTYFILINNINSKKAKANNKCGCISNAIPAYAILNNPSACADIKNGCVSMIAKTTIPVSYAVFGGITLASSVIFATLMFLHLVYSFSLINIWYTAMLFLGSAGLFLVDLFAIRDWMKLAGVYIRKKQKIR